VLDTNKIKFQQKLAAAMDRLQISSHAPRGEANDCARRILNIYEGWVNSFRLVENINDLGQSLLQEVIQDQPRRIRRIFER